MALHPMNELPSNELLAIRAELEAELVNAPVQTDLRKLGNDPGFKRLLDIAGKLGVISEILSFRGVVDEDGNVIATPTTGSE
jgi:hypothetical protein